MTSLSSKNLLDRVNLEITLNELIYQIQTNYNLEKVTTFTLMNVGYEELNILLSTQNKKYVVKIFSKDKNLENITSNVTSLIEYEKGGVPVPKLYKNIESKYLYQIKQKSESYLIIMDYFDGQKFTEIKPDINDMTSIVRYLSQIHKLNFKTHANYDSWLSIYLLKEFNDKKSYLTSFSLELITPIIYDLKKVDFTRLSKSIVHFDLHRENAMKDKNGNYVILDLACTDTNYRVYDLATYLALFCLDGEINFNINNNIYKNVVQTYQSLLPINEYELEILPLLIKNTYASNVLIPEYLEKSGTDSNPTQTKYYKNIGLNGLLMLSKNNLYY